MKDRLFKLESNHQIQIYEPSSSEIAGILYRLIYGSLCLYVGLSGKSDPEIVARATIGIANLLIAYSFDRLLFRTVQADAPFTSAEFRNFFLGPLDYVRLNMWARHIIELERQADQKSSVNSSKNGHIIGETQGLGSLSVAS